MTGRHAAPLAPRPFPARPAVAQAAWWRRLPAPLPPLLGLMAGILIGFGGAWGWPLGVLGLGVAAASRKYWLLPLVLLAALLGQWREQTWERAPNVLAGYVGGTLTLQGRWDGQFLTLTDPPSQVALSPKPFAPPGQMTVKGVLTLPPGRRIPGGFDYAFWLKSQGVRTVLAGAVVKTTTPEPGFRSWFRRGLASGLPPQEAALLTAVELGDKNALSSQDRAQAAVADGYGVQDSFTRSGLAHLMALSGQNVALLVGLLTLVFVRTPLGRVGLWRYPLMMLALLGFLWLVGLAPSIVRAVSMGELALLGLWLGRGRLDVYGVLSLTALGGLTAQPSWLFDVGFQLSYLAVLGLTLSGRAAARLPERWPEWVRLPLVASLLAEVATLPVVAGTFHQLSLVGLPANLLAEGLMAALVPLGFLAGLLGPLGWLPNSLNGLLLDALLWVAGTFAKAPTLPWGMIAPVGFAAYGVFALSAALWLRKTVPLWTLAAVTLLCVFGTALPARLAPAREVVFLDVGQGDSTLIRTGTLNMLIDGGGTPHGDYDVGAGTVVPALRALGVNRLDVVVATHADADHIEGLGSVLNLMPVGELWIGQRKSGDPVLAALLNAATERHVPVREVRRGDHVQSGDVRLNVLWPKGAPWSEADNENSVVVQLVSPRFRTAVLGDLPDPAETYLGLGHLDLLKTAHHGSRFSTGEALLAETQPRDAVISVGRNTYGHPNGEVLARLSAHGAKVWRTDELGTIRWPIP